MIAKTFVPWHQMVLPASCAFNPHHVWPLVWPSIYTHVCLPQCVSRSGIQISFLSMWGIPMHPAGPNSPLTFFHMPLKTIALSINLCVFLLSSVTPYFSLFLSNLNCELVEGTDNRQKQCKKV